LFSRLALGLDAGASFHQRRVAVVEVTCSADQDAIKP
jgi:hypothetical protein